MTPATKQFGSANDGHRKILAAATEPGHLDEHSGRASGRVGQAEQQPTGGDRGVKVVVDARGVRRPDQRVQPDEEDRLAPASDEVGPVLLGGQPPSPAVGPSPARPGT